MESVLKPKKRIFVSLTLASAFADIGQCFFGSGFYLFMLARGLAGACTNQFHTAGAFWQRWHCSCNSTFGSCQRHCACNFRLSNHQNILFLGMESR